MNDTSYPEFFPGERVALAGALLTAVVALLPGSALAQQQPAVASADQLQLVVVTATKQAAAVDVSKVPISISAYTRETLDAQGVTSLADVAAMTPGVNFTQQNQYGGTAQSNIEIRGIQSRTGAPTTAIYYDETPLLVSGNEFNNGANTAQPLVFDMERIEVLRGPQGTLFGNSAEGGAVRYIPTPPSLTDFSTYGRASLADTRYGAASYEEGMAIGGPVVPGQLGFRASAWYRQDGGWIDRCQPAVMQAGCLYTLDTNVNNQQSIALRLAATWAPTDALRITPNLYYQRLHYADGGGYEIADSDPANGKYFFGIASAMPATDEMFIPSLRIEAQLGHEIALTSITSYVWRNDNFQTDYTEYQDFAFFGNPYPLTGAPDDFGRGDYITSRDDLFEELRLAGGGPGSRVAWVAGVFLEHAHQFDRARVVHPDLPALILANYGQTIEQVLGVPPYLGTYVYWADTPTNNKQAAAFGNADIRLTDTIKLNLGARWAHFTTDSSLFLAGPFNGGNFTFSGSASSNAFTPKVGLTWQPDQSSTYYLSAGKGYRAGGVNDQTTSLIPTCHVSAPVAIEPDSLWSYEIGAKNSFFERRLLVDASAFFIDWRNIQNATDIPQCGILATFNLGNVVSKGFDLSLQALLGRSFKLGLGVSYTDAYFKDTIVVPEGGIGQIVTAGDRVAGASDISGPAVPPWAISTTGEYDFLAFGQNLYLSLQDLFLTRNNGPFLTHDPANALEYDPNLPTDPSTNMLNLRFGWQREHLDLKLFVDNALNAHPQLAVNHALPGDLRLSAVTFRPLTVGISATYRN